MMETEDDGPTINGLSTWYDVFEVYRDKIVTVRLRQNTVVLHGRVAWVGSHLVELVTPNGMSHWIGVSEIAAVTSRP